ncbi:MAG TPA: HAD family phosphatase [Acidimicrobiales bacterium]|jgi:putative hydrolase of the HAD superfamily|nr:HAD family phosphatase [Acidimicrobiales bacterium]
MITHLLVDYGEVMSQLQPPQTLRDLAGLAGMPLDELSLRYWQYRPDYDRGQTSDDYWSIVLRRSLASDDPLLAELVATDVQGWLHLNAPTLRILFDSALAGIRLALLSNAPHPQADAMDAFSWAGLFGHRLYSCRLGIAKPDPSIYEQALDTIGATPEQTLFIDDKPANTRAARRLGIRTLTFSSSEDLAAALDGLIPVVAPEAPVAVGVALPSAPSLRS